jgi:hypothetical protein
LQNGFVSNSIAPLFIAWSEIGILPYPVIKMIEVNIRGCELALKIETASARQPDIEHKQSGSLGALFGYKFRQRTQRLDLQAHGKQQSPRATRGSPGCHRQ